MIQSTKARLAIFDLDGTLVDTEAANVEAYRLAFQAMGFPFDADLYRRSLGLHWSQVLPLLVDVTPEQLASLRAAKQKYYATVLHLSEPNAAVVALFHGKAATHHRAIVTSASRPNAENVLRHMGLLQDVELLLAADDIARPKPHPEGFLKAMRHFAIGPEATEIYEDSATGLAAARATGALVVDVKSLDLK